MSQVSDKQFLQNLHDFEVASQKTVTIKTPKQGVFGKQRSFSQSSGKPVSTAELARALKIYAIRAKHIKSKESALEAEKLLSHIAANLKNSETLTPGDIGQIARFEFFDSLIRPI